MVYRKYIKNFRKIFQIFHYGVKKRKVISNRKSIINKISEFADSINSKNKSVENLAIAKNFLFNEKKQKIQNIFKLAVNISKFKNILKQNSSKFRWRKLKKMHFEIIADPSYFSHIPHPKYLSLKTKDSLNKEKLDLYKLGIKSRFKYQLMNFLLRAKNYCQKNIFSKISKQFLKMPTFLSDSKFSMIWDCINLILLQFVLFYFPFHIGVEFLVRKNIVLFYDIFRLYIPFVFFFFDIFIRFNTSYYYKGELIENKLKIAKNYSKTSFIPDVLSVIFLGQMIFSKSSFLTVLILLKTLKIATIIKRLKDHIYITNSMQSILGLLTLLYKTLYITHLCACIWHFSSMYLISQGFNNTWLNTHNIIDDNAWVRYINALYYTVCCMITVGVVETNCYWEKLISIFIMLILAGIFAYSINTIGNILKEINKSSDELRYILNDVNFFMNKRNLSHNLKMKVRRHIEYIHDEEEIIFKEGFRIINSFNKNLRNEIQLESYGKIIKNMKFFSKNFSSNLINELTSKVQEISFGPEEIIKVIYYIKNKK